MEVITLSGYTTEEKEHIPPLLGPEGDRRERSCRLSPEFVSEALLRIIEEYTREAGVRPCSAISLRLPQVAKEITQGKPAGRRSVPSWLANFSVREVL